MQQMVETHIKATYNIFTFAKERNIKKIIFASSNHINDILCISQNFKLGREININDYPYSIGLYGAPKWHLNIGFGFSHHCNMPVINLRLGMVSPDEKEAVKESNR